jgi:ribosomal protein L37AE/L43A
LEQIGRDRRDALNRIGEANRTAVSVVSARTDRFGGGLAWFTLIALGVFVFSIGIEEVHRKGAGITEVVVPGQYDFLPNLFGELQFAIENRLNYRLRAKIREFEALTPLLEELDTKPARVSSARPLVANPYMKPCKQCGKPYPERTSWQLFCCKKCRMLFHETNHGRPYLPHRVYRAKLKEMNMNLFED